MIRLHIAQRRWKASSNLSFQRQLSNMMVLLYRTGQPPCAAAVGASAADSDT